MDNDNLKDLTDAVDKAMEPAKPNRAVQFIKRNSRKIFVATALVLVTVGVGAVLRSSREEDELMDKLAEDLANDMVVPAE